MNTSLVIQAGGASSRMGQNKALLPFKHTPLIQRIVERLSPIFNQVIITSNRPPDYAFLGLPVYPDLKPGQGALGGLLTALHFASNPHVAVVACDMPFASRSLLEYQLHLLDSENWDVVIPGLDSGLEPLHSAYRRETCLPAVEAALEALQLRMISWFSNVKVRVLTNSEIAIVEPSPYTFMNVNTPEEFAQAEALDDSSSN